MYVAKCNDFKFVDGVLCMQLNRHLCCLVIIRSKKKKIIRVANSLNSVFGSNRNNYKLNIKIPPFNGDSYKSTHDPN